MADTSGQAVFLKVLESSKSRTGTMGKHNSRLLWDRLHPSPPSLESNLNKPMETADQQPLGEPDPGDRDSSLEGFSDSEAFAQIYGELRAMAQRYMRNQKLDHTLQPTALVNEAYLKIVNRRSGQNLANFGHLKAMAAKAMRNLLIDHARSKARLKRTPGEKRVPLEAAALDQVTGFYQRNGEDLIDLDEALRKLQVQDPEMVRLVELRFFGGFKMKEIAEILGLPLRTAERKWTWAKIWLHKEIHGS
ncbi:MAG: hypothetical protein DWQ01_01980 [Planctomycetota bacterium]|nr:MAG: hypothetical protein DWQ01_01980 [Planctomycetota bacterium]